MKLLTAFTLLFLFDCSFAKGQILKGNWLMGGSGSFSHSNGKASADLEYKSTTIDISPNIGYFFSDKFAGGLRIGLNRNVLSNIYYKSRTTTFLGGPFARYYFLDKENYVNIFSEGTIQFYASKQKTRNSSGDDESRNGKFGISAYSFSAGPAIFLNSSVALEASVSYQKIPWQSINKSGKENTISFKIGFQIHLEKENE